MSIQAALLTIAVIGCLLALGAVSFLFWEVYKAASHLVEKIDEIFKELNDMDTCSKNEVEQAIREVNGNTRP